MTACWWRCLAKQSKQANKKKKGAPMGAPFFSWCSLLRLLRAQGKVVEILRLRNPMLHPMKPRLLVEKLAKLGKMEGKLAAPTPNQVASVAAY